MINAMTTDNAFSNEEFSDAILPAQYHDLINRRQYPLNGECRLLWAVLEEAIRTYLDNMNAASLSRRKAFDQVREWFESEDTDSLFSFRTICEILELDSKQVLRALASIRKSDLPKRHCRSTAKVGRLAG
jgi:hypothetical protein